MVSGGSFGDRLLQEAKLQVEFSVTLSSAHSGMCPREGCPLGTSSLKVSQDPVPQKGGRLVPNSRDFFPMFHSDSQATPICQAPLGKSVPNITGNCLHLAGGVDMINHTPVDLRVNTTCL